MHDPDVRDLVQQIAPGSQPTDLGGTMSLNLRVEPNDSVLRHSSALRVEAPATGDSSASLRV